jgi:aminoglycoside 2'-N-acetyltransferase I
MFDMFQITRISDEALNSAISSTLQNLLNNAFEGDFSTEDWEHTCDGIRFLGHFEDELIAHGAVVSREICVDGRLSLVGYVEGIAVAPKHRRQGFGSSLMAEISKTCRSDFDISMLSTGEKDFYRRLGWLDFVGKSYVAKGETVLRSDDEDEGLMYLPGLSRSLESPKEIICESRNGDAW